jgi:uncharacterized protein (DUF2235 family)
MSMMEVRMPEQQELYRYQPKEFEPLLPAEPDDTMNDSPRPAPRQSYWNRLFSGSPIDTNEEELASDLRPTGTDARGQPTYRRKRIIICADGTWNKPTTKKGEDASTNVWRLFELVKDHGDDGMPQLRYYHAGVGTSGGILRRMYDGASGNGLSNNMRACYRFLVDHYHPGDALYLFGFSRGAYTARTLAGMIRNSGIVDLRRQNGAARSDELLLEEAYRLYRDREPDSLPVASKAIQFRAEHSHPDFQITCIGVWDTVGALGIPVDTPVTSPIRYLNQTVGGFHDVTLSSYVDCAFQALALDEQREAFKPSLWVQQPHARAAGQILEQTWFPGVHSDVGGGYAESERGLADVTLRWMLNRVTENCNLEFDLRPLVKREAAGCSFVIHDSVGWLYKAGNFAGISKPFQRTVDGGLSTEGTRDAERVVTEALHDSARKIALGEVKFAGVRDLTNTRDYLTRREKEKGEAQPPTPGYDRRRVARAADIDSIMLQRLMGGRTVMSVMLTRDGRAHYTGEPPAERQGRFEGQMPPAHFEAIAEELIASRYFDMADRYGTPGDGNGVIVTVISGRRHKSIANYDRFWPARLEDVERAIEDAKGSITWARPRGATAEGSASAPVSGPRSEGTSTSSPPPP